MIQKDQQEADRQTKPEENQIKFVLASKKPI
jgi:hypothetical protein